MACGQSRTLSTVGVAAAEAKVQVEKIFQVARTAYQMAGEPERLRIDVEPNTVNRTAAWLLAALNQ